jgi:hypothetical protein
VRTHHFSRRLAAGLLALAAGLAGAVATAPAGMANPATNTTTTTINSEPLVSSAAGSFTVTGTVTSQYDCLGTVTVTEAKYNKGTGVYSPVRTLTQSVTSTSSGGAYSFTIPTSTHGNATWRYQAEFTPAGPCVGSTSGFTYTTVYKVNSSLTYIKSGNDFIFTVSSSDADQSKVGTPTGTVTLTTSNNATTVSCTLVNGTCTVSKGGSLVNAVYSGDTYYNSRTITS